MIGKRWKVMSAMALMSSLSAQAISQTPNVIYLDCEVNISNGKMDASYIKKMSFKIESKNSYIYEFNFQKLYYVNICDDKNTHFTFCTIYPGEFFAVKNYNFNKGSNDPTGDQNYKMISINRLNGDLFGREVVQIGSEISTEYWLHGTCQKGNDNTIIKKKF